MSYNFFNKCITSENSENEINLLEAEYQKNVGYLLIGSVIKLIRTQLYIIKIIM